MAGALNNARVPGCLTLLAALAVVVVSAILVLGCGGQAKRQQAQYVAHMTADAAFKIITLAYTTQAVIIANDECQDYECQTESNCAALDMCPALIKQAQDWQPIFIAYEALRVAVESGKITEAQAAYCHLVKIAPAPLPPGENCAAK